VSQTPPPRIRVTDLVKEYMIGGRKGTVLRAVNEVSFEIPEGRCLGLVGESGSGKTTTAMICAGLTSATSGTVEVFGTDLTAGIGRAEFRKLRRHIQVVFQDPHSSLDPRMSVQQIITEPLLVHGVGTPPERRQTVADMLNLVGLTPGMATRYPHQLSGGQAQRVSIARALALRPEVLILDEPVASLDLSIQAQILNLLGELRASLGLTYLFIGHDLAAVSYVSDEIAVMELGRIVEKGPVDEVYGNPQDAYTRKLVSAVLDPVDDLGAFNSR
jgi:ABC-type oligopeptide transport system ATPase subunit